MRGVAAGRSAQRACERSSDWRRGGAASPDPDKLTQRTYAKRSPDPDKLTQRTYAKRSPDSDV